MTTITIKLASGKDSISSGSVYFGTPISNFQSYTVTGDANADTINFSSSLAANSLAGNGNGTVITGSSTVGNQFFANFGNETLNGGSGSDRFSITAGNAQINAGAGIDTFIISANASANITTINNVQDNLQVNTGAVVTATVGKNGWISALGFNNGIVNILSNGYAINLSKLTGNNGFNIKDTGSGANITGSNQGDTISGGLNDTITAGNGSNIFNAASGDTLTAGVGVNIINVLGTSVIINNFAANKADILNVASLSTTSVNLTGSWIANGTDINLGSTTLFNNGNSVDVSLSGWTYNLTVPSLNNANPNTNLTSISAGNYTSINVNDINDNNVLVGQYTTYVNNQATQGGFVGSTLVSYDNAGDTVVNGINSNGAIVGSYLLNGVMVGFCTSNAADYTAVKPDQTIVDNIAHAGDLPANNNTYATGISSAGIVVGYDVISNGSSYSFTYNIYTKSLTEFNLPKTGSFLGSTDFEASNISSNGVYIVGSFLNSSGITNGFIYNTQTGIWGVVSDSNSTYGTYLTGVNNAGNAVGYYDSNNSQYSFVYSVQKNQFLTNGISDPNLLKPNLTNNYAGQTVTQITGINDQGVMAGNTDNLYGFTTNLGENGYSFIDAKGGDTLTGSSGLDTFTILAGTDTINFGNSADILHVSSGATANVNLDVNSGYIANKTSINNGKANLSLGATAQYITVSMAAINTGNAETLKDNGNWDTLIGSIGLADTIFGGLFDTIIVGSGNETINAVDGDSITGSTGAAVFNINSGAVYITNLTGNDVLNVSSSASVTAVIGSTGWTASNLSSSLGQADLVTYGANINLSTIKSGNGITINDYGNSAGTACSLIGSSLLNSTDNFYDFNTSKAGDTLSGGAGADTYIIGSTLVTGINATITNLGQGNDSLLIFNGDSVNANINSNWTATNYTTNQGKVNLTITASGTTGHNVNLANASGNGIWNVTDKSNLADTITASVNGIDNFTLNSNDKNVTLIFQAGESGANTNSLDSITNLEQGDSIYYSSSLSIGTSGIHSGSAYIVPDSSGNVFYHGVVPTNLTTALNEIITDLAAANTGNKTLSGETVFFNCAGNVYLLITGAGDTTVPTNNDTLIHLIGVNAPPSVTITATHLTFNTM